MPRQGYPVAQFSREPGPQSGTRSSGQQQELQGRPVTQGPAPQDLIARGKSADEEDRVSRRVLPERPPQRERLRLPSPEELGVACARLDGGKAIDWADVHRRLDRLGAISFHQEKLGEEGYRITFQLPSDRPNRAHQFEAEAGSAAQAICLALERAETWTGRK